MVSHSSRVPDTTSKACGEKHSGLFMQQQSQYLSDRFRSIFLLNLETFLSIMKSVIKWETRI